MKRIYLDYAATTPVDARVKKVMLPYLDKKFWNTVSLHSFGQAAGAELEKSRKKVAKLINAEPEEIVFTASATESNNLALKGIVSKNKGKHIIISSIEHPCIIESAHWLRRQGVKITELPVDKYGLINLNNLKKAVRKDTVLVSIIHGSHEIGTIQPLAEIGRICKSKGAYFHTDASQSMGKIPIDVKKMNIDLLTGSSHKLYGPKGAACLFVKKGVKIDPILHGGGQESGLRASTVNLAAIVGFAEACSIARKGMNKEGKRLTVLRDRLIRGILSKVGRSHLNGHPNKRLPNNVNVRFDFVEGESIAIALDLKGVAVSTGSACSSEKLEASHVLLAIGLKHEQAHGSLRISLGKDTRQKDVDYVLKVLPPIIKRLRGISPYKRNYA